MPMPRQYANATERQREASRRRRDEEGAAGLARWQAARDIRTANVAARREAKAQGKSYQPIPAPACDAASLYRLEKARRADRITPLIEEAKDAYARLMADFAMKAKGGRPRTSPSRSIPVRPRA